MSSSFLKNFSKDFLLLPLAGVEQPMYQETTSGEAMAIAPYAGDVEARKLKLELGTGDC